MKITEVIEALQQHYDTYGDLEVMVEALDENVIEEPRFQIRKARMDIRTKTPGCKCGSCWEYNPIKNYWVEVF